MVFSFDIKSYAKFEICNSMSFGFSPTEFLVTHGKSTSVKLITLFEKILRDIGSWFILLLYPATLIVSFWISSLASSMSVNSLSECPKKA